MTVLNVILIVVLVLQILMIFTLGRLPIDPKEKALEDEEQLLYLRNLAMKKTEKEQNKKGKN
jgi:hypothetical protein